MRMIQKIRRIENGLTNSELNNLRQQIYVEKIEKLKKVPNYIQKVTFILIHLEWAHKFEKYRTYFRINEVEEILL